MVRAGGDTCKQTIQGSRGRGQCPGDRNSDLRVAFLVFHRGGEPWWFEVFRQFMSRPHTSSGSLSLAHRFTSDMACVRAYERVRVIRHLGLRVLEPVCEPRAKREVGEDGGLA
jgi:hypothetical protein